MAHDTEEAKTQDWDPTLVMLDGEGAFDAVLHNRLIWWMQAQEWPKLILRWTIQNLESRRVQIRFQEGITDPKELICGVPQGSPI